MIDLLIPGPPVGKGRPKFVKATGRTYTPAQTRLAENRVYLAWLEAGQPRMPEAPIELIAEFVLARPQAHWRTDGTLSLAGQRSQWPTKKPDLDNAVKLIADALNGCAFRDDAHIVRIIAVKRWANPGEDDHARVRIGVAATALREAA